MDDGDVIISGQIKFASDPSFRTGARLNANGTRDLNFPEVAYMGGKLTRWNDRIYSANGQTVRRQLLNGQLDPAFIQMNSGLYFLSLQGGDYHVYPDGRILMSGAHELQDSIRGFEGLYNLIWFSNTGYLDTTKTHRAGDGVIYRFAELPNGKFICTGPMTVFDGHQTSNIFRVHPDGALDTTFHTGVNWGQAFGYLPLDDGRCYVGGLFKISGNSDTLQLVRFMPDGSLDPTFNMPDFDLGVLTGFGGTIGRLYPLSGGRVLVTGGFQFVDGIPHRGICIVDSTGQLETSLVDHGCGPYVYQTFTYGSLEGAVMLPDNMMYVYGAYHGYNDGTLDDPDQRFVTRLYGPDFGMGVEEGSHDRAMQLYPNPSSGRITISMEQLPRDAAVVVRDAMGREVLRRRMSDHYTTLVLERSGVYMLEIHDARGRIASERVVVE